MYFNVIIFVENVHCISLKINRKMLNPVTIAGIEFQFKSLVKVQFWRPQLFKKRVIHVKKRFFMYGLSSCVFLNDFLADETS